MGLLLDKKVMLFEIIIIKKFMAIVLSGWGKSGKKMDMYQISAVCIEREWTAQWILFH